MKIGNQEWTCSKCNQVITQNKYTWLIMEDLLFELKIHYHCKFKHKRGFFTSKGITKRLLLLLPFGIAQVIVLILWLITYPFWILHEII